MHGTFKSKEAIPKTTDKPQTEAAKARAAQRERDKAFAREFALAKRTPVPTPNSGSRTIFC